MKYWHLLILTTVLMCCQFCVNQVHAETRSNPYNLYIYRFYWTPIELTIPSERDYAAIVSPLGETIVFRYPKEGVDRINLKRYSGFVLLLNGDTPIGASCYKPQDILTCLKGNPSIPLLTTIAFSHLASFISSNSDLCKGKQFVKFSDELRKNSTGILIFPAIYAPTRFDSSLVFVNGVIHIDIESETDLEYFDTAIKYKCSVAFVIFRIPVENHESYLKRLVDHGIVELYIEYYYNNVQINFEFLRNSDIRVLSILPCLDIDLEDKNISTEEDFEKFAHRFKTTTIPSNIDALPPLDVLRLANNWNQNDVIAMGVKTKTLSLEYFRAISTSEKMSETEFVNLKSLRVILPTNDDDTNAILSEAMKACKILTLYLAPHLIERTRLDNVRTLVIKMHRAYDLDIRKWFPEVQCLQVSLFVLKKYSIDNAKILVLLPRRTWLTFFNGSKTTVVARGGGKVVICNYFFYHYRPLSISITVLVRN